MQKLIRILTAVLLAAAVWLVASVNSFLAALERTTVTLPATLDRTAAREAEAMREMLSRLVNERGNAIDKQLTGLRSDIRQMEGDLAGRAEKHLSLMRRDLKHSAFFPEWHHHERNREGNDTGCGSDPKVRRAFRAGEQNAEASQRDRRAGARLRSQSRLCLQPVCRHDARSGEDFCSRGENGGQHSRGDAGNRQSGAEHFTGYGDPRKPVYAPGALGEDGNLHRPAFRGHVVRYVNSHAPGCRIRIRVKHSQAIVAEAGIVRIHAHTMLAATPQRTALKRWMVPTPAIEPAIA